MYTIKSGITQYITDVFNFCLVQGWDKTVN